MKRVEIYADIVRIQPASASLPVNTRTVLIVARMLEVKEESIIVLDERSAGFFLYAQKVEGTLHFSHEANPSTIAWTLDHIPVQSVGVEVYTETGTIGHDPINRLNNEMVRWLRPTRNLLTTQFQLAAALFTGHVQETHDLLDWILFLTKDISDGKDLYRQAETLLARLLLLPSTAVFVPPLSLETYQQEATALFGTVKSYEQEYARFQDINSDLADRQAAVRLMIQQNNATIDAHHQLITQAQNLLSQAQEQAEQAKQKCEDQQYQTKLAKIEFERGLEEWQAEQKWNAMRRMFLAIGDFAISVGTAAATGGGSAAEAIASGLDALKAMLELVGETNAIYKEMARVLESMQHLEGLVQELENLMKSLLTLTSTDPDAIIEFPDFSLPNLDHISGQAEWDVFLAATDIYLQQALDKNIGGAMAYKLESTKLGIYGKAFLASQAAVVKAAQELWQLLVQAQISQSQQQPLEDYLNELEEREELHTALLQLLFQQQLNQKCWLFLALQNLIWAYQYETIIDRLEVPPITASALELEQALADVVVRLNRILEELNPPPQAADPRQLIEEIEAEHSNYDGVVETFKQHKEVTINVPLHDFSFRGLDRVRVKRWRCVLQGVPVPKGRRISLSLESSGIHTDRWQHEAYQFVARPSIRRFVYEEWHSGANKTIVDDVLGVEHAIFVDGEVAEEYKSHYARPTSFTQWTLRLDDTEGIVDLSTLQSLKLLWQVEAVITNPTAAQT